MLFYAQLTEDYQRELHAARISTCLRVLKSPASSAEEVKEAVDKLEEIADAIWPGSVK